MPELPEVETICRDLRPLVTGQRVTSLVVRCAALRWPVPVARLQQALPGATIQHVARRGKYILLHTEQGCLIVHLGMSGTVHLVSSDTAPEKHDHVDLHFASGACLRYADPRRFGCLLWTDQPPSQHPLLVNLGPEPLTESFNARYLWQRAQGKKVAIKNFLMDSHHVVGIGNIYAAEALFHAALHPARPAGSLSEEMCQDLVDSIREILNRAIANGGTTVRDYRRANGTVGSFQQMLQVYGHQGEPCHRCGTPLIQVRLGGRASCCCPACQK
ncbi:MAG: bifunctional DNA-formamidopyrimidine glycosylase/DNA-(apurinic or apyrimidinic site) lyase [Magnetococcales bacterium]|nr:bifunctional DNA-formamidopyrimidine glycosylase/DNA-(apurinic or apyrimidinic site) lyase [Magnetococcales bacterium]